MISLKKSLCLWHHVHKKTAVTGTGISNITDGWRKTDQENLFVLRATAPPVGQDLLIQRGF